MASVDFRGLRPKKCLAPRGGVAAIRAGGFLPVKGAAGDKTVAGAYFRMTLKSYWVQKPQTIKVMHIMAPRSHNV